MIPLLLEFYPDIVVVWSTTKLCEGRQLLEILSAEFLRAAVGVSLAVGILLLPDRENPDPRACLHTSVPIVPQSHPPGENGAEAIVKLAVHARVTSLYFTTPWYVGMDKQGLHKNNVKKKEKRL